MKRILFYGLALGGVIALACHDVLIGAGMIAVAVALVCIFL